jgi:hypothetical protein
VLLCGDVLWHIYRPLPEFLVSSVASRPHLIAYRAVGCSRALSLCCSAGHEVAVHDVAVHDIAVHDVAVHDVAVHDVAQQVCLGWSTFCLAVFLV